jgi:hypothetical protein
MHWKLTTAWTAPLFGFTSLKHTPNCLVSYPTGGARKYEPPMSQNIESRIAAPEVYSMRPHPLLSKLPRSHLVHLEPRDLRLSSLPRIATPRPKTRRLDSKHLAWYKTEIDLFEPCGPLLRNEKRKPRFVSLQKPHMLSVIEPISIALNELVRLP